MDRKQKLNMLFDAFAEELNITRTMFDNAERAYNALGDYIKDNNTDWDVKLIPQGSFAMGTVVKPVLDDGQYDVDLIVRVASPIMRAETLRKRIYLMLTSHGRYDGKIESKKPCIRIQYADSSQFHMDIVSAQPIFADPPKLNLAKFDGVSLYDYDPSNPLGYIEWFKQVMNYQRVREDRMRYYAKTEVKEIELPYVRTPLQKAVQILKRHRDIFSEGREEKYIPSSIIITTLCGLTYNYQMTYAIGTGNVYDALQSMLQGFQQFIKRNSDGAYSLPNPSYTTENFLAKWNDDENYVKEFSAWINKATQDILVNPERYIEADQSHLNLLLENSFGKNLSASSLKRYAEGIGKLASNGEFRYNPTNQSITTSKEDKEYKPHTYFGVHEE